MKRFSRLNRSLASLSVVAATTLALAPPASAQETFKLGIVTFLSGPAADSFGVPARNGAQFVIDQLNKGAAPAPYEKVGFGGMKIEPVIIDENGGATKQVQELRNLYQRDNVDAVLGYISSGDCLAVAPIAEELKKMLVLMDCGTPRIFEEGKYNYVFRTAAHATMDNVGLVRYMKAKNIKMDTLSAINQDYAWVRIAGPTLSLQQGKFIQTSNLRRTFCRSSAPASTAPKSPPWSARAAMWSIRACGAATCRLSFCRPLPAACRRRASWYSVPPITCCRRSATRCPTAPSSARAGPTA